jgi:hypothetical protein
MVTILIIIVVIFLGFAFYMNVKSVAKKEEEIEEYREAYKRNHGSYPF